MMQRHQRVILRNGLKMQLDLDRAVQHTVFWNDGDMEAQLTWAVREFLPVGGTFIDCGANCGYAGLEARLYKHARVLFVEPHPELAATIRTNVELNDWNDSCKVIQAAASDMQGTASLFISRENHGAHSLLPDWWAHKGEAERVEVESITLKQLISSEPGFDKVDFLKIDTEGHDFNVLVGLGDMLVPDRISMLYTEMGRDRERACHLLNEHGYAGFVYTQKFNPKQLKRAARRYADGERIVFYAPVGQGRGEGEMLWCAKGTATEVLLRELAECDHTEP